MDRSSITAALNVARGLVLSHGIANHMNAYSRKQASAEISESAGVVRFDFVLDPNKSMWGSDNPCCSIVVGYAADPKGARQHEDGSVVMDHFRYVTCRAGTEDINLARFREREAMLNNLVMLGEMIESVLPPSLTILIMSSEDAKEKRRREGEQLVGSLIHESIGAHSLKGLRKGGSSRVFRLHMTASPPAEGRYEYTHIRRRNSRGQAVDKAKYVIRVHGETCSVWRTE